MKKLIYSLISLSIIFAGCTKFDDYPSKDFGAGPDIDISVSLISDSTFVLTLTPGANTDYYSYVVEEAETPAEVNNYDLLKGKTYTGVINEVLKVTKDKPNATINMKDAKGAPMLKPNTTYQIYAVAANQAGIAGAVKTATAKTTDGVNPTPQGAVAKDSAIVITFSEVMQRGTGKVTATYYKEFDLANPETVVVPDSNIMIKGAEVTIATPNAHTGIYVLISWEDNAFKDLIGNPVQAFTSKVLADGKFKGISYRIPSVAFDIPDSTFISPKVGSVFGDWNSFEATVDLGMNLYRIEKNVKAGDIELVYNNKNKRSYVKLPANKWKLNGTKLIFNLPVEPEMGDSIGVKIKDGIIFDVYANANKAYTNESGKWMYFVYKKEMVMGKFKLTTTADDSLLNDQTIEVTEDTGTAVNIKLKVIDKEVTIKGNYDLDKGKLYIPSGQFLGKVKLKNGNTASLITFNINENMEGKPIEFLIMTNGVLVCNPADQFGILATAETDLTQVLGLLSKETGMLLTPIK